MNMTAVMALLLLTHAQSAPIDTRIVESRESPVTLVGQPCDDGTQKVSAVEPQESNAPQLESRTFACGQDCTVGVRVKSGQEVASVKIATAALHDRGKVTSAVSPALDVASLKSCNGESYYVAALPRIDWPINASVVFVSEVTYKNGTTWKVDANEFPITAFRKSLPRPKRRQ